MNNFYKVLLIFSIIFTSTLKYSVASELPSTVNICAMMQAKEGKEDQLRDLLLSLVKPTRSDIGHITYDVYEESDGALFLHEVWRSQQDLNIHLGKSYIQNFVKQSGNFLDGPNEAHFGKVIAFHENNNIVPSEKNISVCSVKRPREGKANELRQALISLVAPTSSEQGSMVYHILEETNGSFFLFEKWRSIDDFNHHLSTSYVRDFRSKVAELTNVNDVHVGKLISN